jgi:hypothetical protein
LGLVASHLKNLLDVAPIYCPLKKIATWPACLLAASTMILLLGGKAKVLPLGGMGAAKKWAFLITFI